MQLRQLLSDEDGVSPVIGVILMVAITVILAAVIASFVLGLNEEQEVAPQHKFTFNYDSDDGVVTITSQGGEAIRHDELYIRGSGFCGATCSDGDIQDAGEWPKGPGFTSGETEETSAVSAGDSLDVGVNSDYSISVAWESKDTSTSTTLSSDTGPAA